MSPPAAVGAAFVAMGATTATGLAVTAFVTTVYVGAAIGAVVGAGVALVTGGDVLQGAVKGAIIGGVTKGVGSFFGQAGNAANAASGVGEAGMTGAAGIEGAAEGANMVAGGTEALASAGTAAEVGGSTAATTAATGGPSIGEGLFSGAANFAKSDAGAEIIGRTAAGAAEGMLTAKSNKDALEAAMKRDQLAIDSKKVDLSGLDFKVALPTIKGFTAKPNWQIPQAGLLEGKSGNPNT